MTSRVLRFCAGSALFGALGLVLAETHPRTDVTAKVLNFRSGDQTYVWRQNPYGSVMSHDDGEPSAHANPAVAVAEGLRRSRKEAPWFWRWYYGWTRD